MLGLAVVVAQAIGLAHRLIHPHGIAPRVLLVHGDHPPACVSPPAPGCAPTTIGVLRHELADAHDEGGALCLLLDQLAVAGGVEATPSSAEPPQREGSCDSRAIGVTREPRCAAYFARAPPTA